MPQTNIDSIGAAQQKVTKTQSLLIADGASVDIDP